MRCYVILISLAMMSLSIDLITDLIFFSDKSSGCIWFHINCGIEVINNFFELFPAGLIFFVIIKSMLESEKI